MKSLILALFAIAVVSASQNQTVSVSDDPVDFFVGVSLGLGINVTSDMVLDCEGNYYGAVVMTGEFFKYLFVDWGVDFALLHGFLGMSYEGFLHDWHKACEPVAYEYGNYFTKAIYAYEENREAFLSQLESNFQSNEYIVIEFGIRAADLIKSHQFAIAGKEVAYILQILLSTWLESEGQTMI